MNKQFFYLKTTFYQFIIKYMKILFTVLTFFMLCTVKAQEKISLKGLSKKEINAIKKGSKRKRIAKLASMGLNQWGIDENAQTCILH